MNAFDPADRAPASVLLFGFCEETKEVLSAFLHSENCAVHVACKGKALTKAFAVFRPKLVVAASNISLADGLTLLENRRSGVKFVILSEDEEAPALFSHLGADRVLSLPLSKTKFLLQIQELLPELFSADSRRDDVRALLKRWSPAKRQQTSCLLEQAVMLAAEHPDWTAHITKTIYPELAARSGLSATAVEQRLRRSIRGLEARCNDSLYLDLFPAEHVSNSFFLLQVARYLNREGERCAEGAR